MKAIAFMLAVCCALLVSAAPAHADKITPSAPLRAYDGPEGEVVVLLEINDSKEMLVYCKHIGGELDGKTVRYLYEDLGKGTKNVYINKKRGSKTYRSYLLSARDNSWELYRPGGKGDDALQLSYSKTDSEKITVDEVMNAYKP